MRKKIIIAAGVIALFILALALVQNGTNNNTENNGENTTQTVAKDLNVPWGIEFLPNEDMLVTERPGTLLRIDRENGEPNNRYEVDGVKHRGEGGLLGVEAHPNFTENRRIFLYMTTENGDMLENRVVSYRLENNSLTQPRTLIEDLPGAIYHDGGRIEFGPDGKLYVTAGDATNPSWAQDQDRLAGKILRLNPDGSIPDSNPFDSPVYSYGHRNPQGLAWKEGNLWAPEHGDSGTDELNRIELGANYGWPQIEGQENQSGMETPVLDSGSDTWAPGGAAYHDGSIFFAGLRGQTLYEAQIDNGEVESFEKHLEDRFGRLRAVEKHNGYLYVTTSNNDGRGVPDLSDDKIIRVDPDNL